MTEMDEMEETGRLVDAEKALERAVLISKEKLEQRTVKEEIRLPRAGDFSDADNSGRLTPEQAAGLRYAGEDEQYYFVTAREGTRLRLPKNRSTKNISDEVPSSRFDPVFRLLLLGFVGLAPAGLGTLVFVPAALVWSLVIAAGRPLDSAGRTRLAVVWALAAVLLALGIPMGVHFLSRVL